ncbi:eukaryotic translation initiation factor, partial [Cystoisospora suis]
LSSSLIPILLSFHCFYLFFSVLPSSASSSIPFLLVSCSILFLLASSSPPVCSSSSTCHSSFLSSLFFSLCVERKWADFELDDDYELGDLVNTASGFETKPDEEGIKTVTNYTQTLRGETLKVTKRIRVIRKCQRINKEVYARKNIMPFGLDAEDGDPSQRATTVRSHEEIVIEIPRSSKQRKFKEEEEDDDFYMADLNPSKSTRDLRQKFRALREDEEGVCF